MDKTLLQWMDGLVGWTGIPNLARSSEVKMRRLKWTPAFALALATAALGEAFIAPHLAYIGMIVMSVVLALSAGLHHVGPMRTKKPDEISDEREQLWRTRSYLFAFGAIALVGWLVVLGIGGYVLYSGFAGWAGEVTFSPLETVGMWLIALANYLVALFAILPTLHASWTMPDIIEDEEEPEGGLRFVKPRR